MSQLKELSSRKRKMQKKLTLIKAEGRKAIAIPESSR
jgi:hypothetical protein